MLLLSAWIVTGRGVMLAVVVVGTDEM